MTCYRYLEEKIDLCKNRVEIRWFDGTLFVLNDPQKIVIIFLHMSIQKTQNFTLISNPFE